jgi:hypothetical protein
MSSRMKPSFQRVKASERRATAKRRVKREEVEERMVLEVTEVLASDRLKVNWAMYQSGATCGGRAGEAAGQPCNTPRTTG